MNKADNDASTRAIDSLINYEVRWCTLYIFYSLYAKFDAFHLHYSNYFSLVSSSDSVLFIQTVKYFNNEAYEASKYDEYLKSKLFWSYHSF